MSQWTEIALLFGLFVLRLGIPLAITLLVAWWLRRLDRKWQAEAEVRRSRTPASAGAPEPAPRLPCWLFRNCPEARKATCPACRNQALPCWLARLRAEGRLPGTCPGCAYFNTPTRSQPTGA